MTLALDTSIIIDIERNRKSTIKILKNLKESYIGKPSIPFMSYMETIKGIQKKSTKNKIKALQKLEYFHFLSPSKSCAKTLAKLKIKYDKKGCQIPLTDLFIAAQTIDEGLVLVTKDKIFNQIEELDAVII